MDYLNCDTVITTTVIDSLKKANLNLVKKNNKLKNENASLVEKIVLLEKILKNSDI